MNTDAITAKILEEARAQAAATLSDADERAGKMRAAAEAEGAKKREEALSDAKRQAEQMRDRMLRMAELDQKKALLAVKREVIDQAFEDALSRMTNLSAPEKKSFLEKLLLSAAQGGEELIVSSDETALYDDGYMAELNSALAKAGKKPVRLSKTARPLGGGFVLKDGGMEINCTYRAALSQARPSLEAEVAGMLFA